MYLSVDYGSRYVGLAATDSDGRISYRYGTIDQTKENVFDRLLEITAKEKTTTVLVGLPIALSGNETAQTEETREFIAALRSKLPAEIEIKETDETLTSIEAANQIRFEGGSKEDEHAEAARIMLESFLQENSRS